MEEIAEEAIHVHQLQATTKKISITREMNEPFYVFADKDMVTLVLRNLFRMLSNLLLKKATIIVRLKNESPYCRVSIIDNGIGMDNEALKRIQENNYYSTYGTAKESGTGLGLMLSKDFLSRNGGALLIESEPGKGSVFSLHCSLSGKRMTACRMMVVLRL